MCRSSSSRWLALVVTALLFVSFAGACGGDTGGPAGEPVDGGDVDASVARDADAAAPEDAADGGRDARNDAVAEDTGRPDAPLTCGAETECSRGRGGVLREHERGQGELRRMREVVPCHVELRGGALPRVLDDVGVSRAPDDRGGRQPGLRGGG